MEIKLCIGSACHLKGSYEVKDKLISLIENSGKSDKIELKASFCLNRCGEGVTLCVDDEFIDNVFPNTIDEIFKKEILPKVK